MVNVLQVLKDFQERTRVIRKKLAPNQTKKDYIEIKGLLLSLCRALWGIFRAKMENLAG